ncbi:MAG: hypothetical protein COT84_02005 [Chlamydiae bacterium CG10_big_fil_rev_8_21_14_0_10_35_9]|nr:MAG: hypothetical protein COT84_02005 [Chlamydiae bacterium CG10_big_fil_rev_8_21_14_0_10_35_9]
MKKKSKKKVVFATFDIEAFDWINFLCVGFYDGNKKIYRWFPDLEEAIGFMYDYCKAFKIKVIFGHFAGKYDFNFLLKSIFFGDKQRFTIGGMIPRGSGILSMEIKERRNAKKKGINFVDSSALFPVGLKKLAKSMNVEIQKGSVDFKFLEDAWHDRDYSAKVLTAVKNVPLDAIAEKFESVLEYRVFYDGKEIKKLPKNYDRSKIRYCYSDFKSKDDKDYYEFKIDGKEEVLHYLEKDCISLWQSIYKFYQWPLVNMAGHAITVASQALRVWEAMLEVEVASLNWDEDDFVRKAYYGGRTEIFRTMYDNKYLEREYTTPFTNDELEILDAQIKRSEKLYYYDVNSLYPTVMSRHEYPCAFKKHLKGEKDFNGKAMAIWEVIVDVPESLWCPPLGISHEFDNGDVRFIFPTGVFRGHWTVYELEYAKSLGVTILKFIKGIEFESGGYLFKKFIDTLYKMRLKAKQEKDSVTDMITKLLMNSCYGKLGMNIDREQLVIDDYFSLDLIEHSLIYDEKSDIEIRLCTKPVQLSNSKVNVAIPCFVTSYSRVLMHKECYMKAGKDHLFYTDTDSIFTTMKFDTGEKLGDLKLEYEVDSACFLLPKTYINEYGEGFEAMKKKITMKGFESRKTSHFKYEDLVEFLRGDLAELKIMQDFKFATLKTAMNRGSFLDMLNDPKRNKLLDEQKLQRWEKKYKMILEKDADMAIEWRRNNPKPKLKKSYDYSYKSIKSSYSKRILDKSNILTTPIHLDPSKELMEELKNE